MSVKNILNKILLSASQKRFKSDYWYVIYESATNLATQVAKARPAYLIDDLAGLETALLGIFEILH